MKKILFYLITTIMILIPINVQANSKITYQSHISNVGWQKTTIDGSISGTTGQGLALEGYQIKLVKKKKQRKMIKKMNMFQK